MVCDWSSRERQKQWTSTIGKVPREKTVFATVEHLFDEMRVDQKTYVLFGHSAGGQVAHRMALLFPENRASVIVAANPGWYTMPDYRKEKVDNPFPWMSEAMDLKKEKNFFETRVIEYQSGGALAWD